VSGGHDVTVANSDIHFAGDNTGMTIDEELSALMDRFFRTPGNRECHR
jgi:hypothetical protein